MSCTIRWHVSFATGGVELGVVTAPDRAAALEKARAIYGPAAVVQSAASRRCAALERRLPGPADPLPTKLSPNGVPLGAKRKRKRDGHITLTHVRRSKTPLEQGRAMRSV